jgi:hypothetical protein
MAEDEWGTDKAQDTSFKVTDRRHFTAEGERRGEIDEVDEIDESPATPPNTGPDAAEGKPGPQAQFDRRPLDEPEGVDFTMLVNAMAQPALLYLGEIPHSSSGEKQLDLEQARIQVDMLDLLRVKCRGNLSSQEEGLLERVLYELRMLYVARAGKPG